MREKKALLRHYTAALCLPAAIAIGAVAFALPASAAPSANAAPSVTAAPSAIAAQLAAARLKGPLPTASYRGVTWGTRTVTTSSSRAVRALMGAAAYQPCQTITTTVWYNNLTGQTLWYYYQHTAYCWDGVTVTNHVTWENINIPAWSSLLGWGYKGVISSEFNCFYATGRWCSGNHEYSQAEFQLCIFHVGCVVSVYPWADQNEYYNGQFNGNGGT